MRSISEIKNDVEQLLPLEKDCIIDEIIDILTCNEGKQTFSENQILTIAQYITALEYEIKTGEK
jgi:hypothetical protein